MTGEKMDGIEAAPAVSFINFEIDLNSLRQRRDSAISNAFSIADKHYIAQFYDKKEMMKHYRDIPVSLASLYAEENVD